MRYFRLLDLVLMLHSAGPRQNRVHAPNVELLKHAYDKENSQLTSSAGFFAPLSIGVLTLLVKTGSELPGLGLTSSTVIVLVVLSAALSLLIAMLGLITFRIQRLKTEFADLPSMYFNLHSVVP